MATCLIDGCTRTLKYPKYGWCQTHYHRWWRHGDPLFVKHEKYAPGQNSQHWLGSDVSYNGAHSRVKRLWGLASQYYCVGCGGSAKEWAYDGCDPEEKNELHRGLWPVRYSPWPEFYMPMCVKCHRLKDRSAWAVRQKKQREDIHK